MRSLANTTEGKDNSLPPPEESSDLLTLDSRDIIDPAVSDMVRRIEKGEKQYDD